MANLVDQDQLFSLNLKISFCCFAHQSGIQGGNSIARASLIHLKTRHLESQQQANLLSVKTRLWTGYGPEPFYFFQNSRVPRGHLRPQFPVHYTRNLWHVGFESKKIKHCDWSEGTASIKTILRWMCCSPFNFVPVGVEIYLQDPNVQAQSGPGSPEPSDWESHCENPPPPFFCLR